MATYGYARVSTADQSTDSQLERLRAAGCHVIRTEKVSGRSREGRDELATFLEFIRPGDELVCVKLDRLGRSTRDVLNLVHELTEKGASLRILEPAISTDGPMGKMVLTVLGMVAEMELGFIKARQREGIEQAKAKGAYRGRRATIDPGTVRELVEEGLGASEIARRLKIGRASVYRILSQ
jgi:DNA invertase Pin-like site-specific DNA recombinase